MTMQNTIDIEDELLLSFYKKKPLSIERGYGVKVWDESEKDYLDFTSGWAVTSLGHCHPVIVKAINEQCNKIIHNPDSGMTYSPARAKLLLEMQKILPKHMDKVFFTNSGAEANDAAMKLARKITGRKKIISTLNSFHGRTIGTVSATGQTDLRNRFKTLIPDFCFVKYGNSHEIELMIDSDTAAVILEPVQGEGGILFPPQNYLKEISNICKKNGTMLIIDEIQTGFFRTGTAFVSDLDGVSADFMTMAKGIAGGFPFGAVAVSSAISKRIEYGDHGGTYIGNPLGCAVAAAVIDFMVDSNIGIHVQQMGEIAFDILSQWKCGCPSLIADVRGKGLLLAVEFHKEKCASAVVELALKKGLILNLCHGFIVRLFPALTITENEMINGLSILRDVIDEVLKKDCVTI